MQIILNGSIMNIQDKITLHELIQQLNYSQNNFAIAVNLTIVPHSRYHEYWLAENDKVEIVVAYQGG